jgi:hypothetical protein
VTFISDSIEEFLSAFTTCLAFIIFPDIDFMGSYLLTVFTFVTYLSPFLLPTDSALSLFVLIYTTFSWLVKFNWEMIELDEYICSTSKFYFQLTFFNLLLSCILLLTGFVWFIVFFLEFKKVLVMTISSSDISEVITHCLDLINPFSCNLLCRMFSCS